MLNYIWAFMILIGIGYGAFCGNMAEISGGVIDSAKEAVELCITMLGIVGFWTGLMEVGKESGLVDGLTKLLTPVLKFLFPRIPKEHKAFQYISVNFIANILGLGWAATPAGLKAMEELAVLERERKKNKNEPLQGEIYINGHGIRQKSIEQKETHPGIASNEMCIFLIMNISSLQLIPVNIIAYRSQYGSRNPAVIIVPAIIATLISTLTAVIFCKIMDMGKKE
ncbi:MAG: nucleoside recognition protein [Lachnospiraceae bacterium]|nr:nucleoside recognition protein [Lachnospiraceae bacterium]